jgi:DNA-binding NarL/FixJ family response regulator
LNCLKAATRVLKIATIGHEERGPSEGGLEQERVSAPQGPPRFALVEGDGGRVGSRLSAIGWEPIAVVRDLSGLDAATAASCAVVVVVCTGHQLLSPFMQTEAARVALSAPLAAVVTSAGTDAAAYVARLGWRGFVSAANATTVIARTIAASARGELAFPPSATTELVRALANFAPMTSVSAAELTPRQRQIVGLIAQGATDAEIATTLRISRSTAHKHVQNARRRLHAKTRSQLVAASRDVPAPRLAAPTRSEA